jgi:ABC-type multidrug transport system fused ATPase/permease subunit
MVWSLEDNPINHRELEIYKYIKKGTGNTELAHTVSRFIDLREYLDSHSFGTPEELRRSILTHDIPIFSKSESEQLFKLIAKKGGAQGELIDNTVNQWVKYMYEWQPSFIQIGIDVVSPFIFIAKTMESTPAVGPLISIALDAVTSTLPVIANSIETLTPEITGFIPLPEAGTIGVIIGWMLASIFVILAMLLNLSRQHFGQAFLVSFLLIPFLGTSLYNGAISGEKFATKVVSKREKLIDTAGDIFGEQTAVALETIIPDPLNVPEDDKPKHKANLMEMSKGAVKGLANSVGMPATGGKRLSRHRHNRSKWQTRRRSRL